LRGKKWTIDNIQTYKIPPILLHLAATELIKEENKEVIKGETKEDRLTCHYEVYSVGGNFTRVIMFIKFCEDSK
jgi:hypothetical protein